MEVIELQTATSTNSYLAAIAPSSPHGTVVRAIEQTAGRGQRGNSWEANPGENITVSMLLRPAGILPAHQFVISQAVSVAIVKMLRRYLPSEDVSVKWPNDIYVGDRKICGILIENTLAGSRIEYSIIGIGLNVNQEIFFSDAPNPCSLTNFTGLKYDVARMTHEMAKEILDTFRRVDIVGQSEEIASEYCMMLWRRDGMFPYRDNLRNEEFMASIHSIAPMGHMTLRTAAGELREYAFKEVSAIL